MHVRLLVYWLNFLYDWSLLHAITQTESAFYLLRVEMPTLDGCGDDDITADVQMYPRWNEELE